MVIIFVLMVFVLIQVNLAYRVSGQDATLGEMRQQLASLGELLNIERRASADLAANLAQITSQLGTSKADRKEIAAQLVNVRASLQARMADIDRLTAKQTDIQAALSAARASLEERLGALQLAEGQLAWRRPRTRAQTTRLSIRSRNQRHPRLRCLTNTLTALRLRIEELTGLLAEGHASFTR